MDLNLAVGISEAVVSGRDGTGDVPRLATDLVRGPRPAARGDESVSRRPPDRGVPERPLRRPDRGGPSAAARPPSCCRATGSPASCLSRRTRDSYSNEYLTSYRVRNGVLHNPRSDRRTTSGTFHVSEGGLPIPGDKKAVPRPVFVALFRHALAPPAELLVVPFTSAPARAGAGVRLAAAPADRVPGGARRRPREDAWRSASSPRAAW